MSRRTVIRWYRRLGVAGLVCLSAQAAFAQGALADRIAQSVDNAQTVALRGNVHPLARPEFDRGEVSGTTVLPRITVFFSPSAAQQASLDALLALQQDRTSVNYHRWLTPEQFGAQFGLSDADLAKVAAWLQRQGFTLQETAASRNWIAFSGTAQQVSAALGTRIHRYTVGGETHFANGTEPQVPAAFADVIGGFRGLNDFRLHARAAARSVPSVNPSFTSSVSGNHYLSPGDFATIYDVNPLYSNQIDGTGEKVAIMGQTDVNLSDIAAFRSAAGLPAKAPQIVLVGGDPGSSSTDIPEADLDLEWSGGIGKNATIIYVNSTDVLTSMQSAVTRNLAPVISISYGVCEQDVSASEISALVATAEEANAQGITIVAAAGDDGATDCDTSAPATHGLAVDLPASLPYVTGMGGTKFNEGSNSASYWAPANGQDVISSALSYIPEEVWDETSGSEILATGGGASAKFAKPVWQTGLGVPNDGARDVPDASFSASPNLDGYLICSEGSCVNGFRGSTGNLDVIGGTSAGVPTFAAVVALINQETQSSGQGNVNYILYPLATNSPAAFHDIVSGSNEVPCASGTTDCPAGTATIGYVAGPGYDQTTGLGSPDVNNLVTAWTSISPTSLSQSNSGSAPDFQLAVSPSSLSIGPGATGSAQITVTPFNGFTGSPTFICTVGAALGGVTCSVVAGGSAHLFTLKVTTPASSASPAAQQGERPSRWPLLVAMLALVALVWHSRSQVEVEEGQFGSGMVRTRRNLAPRLALVSVLVVAVGCGGGGSSSSSSDNSGGNSVVTAAGSVSVTGTSGSISHTAEINVAMN